MYFHVQDPDTSEQAPAGSPMMISPERPELFSTERV